jgi:DNA polymerase-3 subunit gamma/tau
VQTVGEVPDSFAVTAEHTDRLAAQAERLSQGEVLRAIDLLAHALSTVKDGTDPRIALEVALLKAVQPASDMSVQALMFRIEQLERKLAGAPSTAPAPGPEPVAPRPQGGTSAVAAPAVVAEPEEEEQPVMVAAPELARVQELWPAVLETVRAQNGMVAALLADARPTSLADGRLTVAFPADAEFSRRKAEANADLLRGALQGLSGSSLGIVFELGREVAPEPATRVLGEEELLKRLKDEFGATEVFDEE